MGSRTMKRVVLLAFAGVLVGAAHPEAVLKSSQSSVEAGQLLSLSGEKFDEGGTVDLVLLGVLTEYALREVTANDDGTFTLELGIPENVRPGQYQLVAYAPDGDRVATLDLSVLAAAPASSDKLQGDAGEHARTVASGGRADEMPIERATTGLGWGLIGLLIGLSGGVGVALLRGAAAPRS